MPLSLDGTGSIIGISTVSVSDDLTHVGDVNTKISFPANDTISFETAGSERLRVNSNGQVLLGTTTTPSNSNSKFRVHFDQNTSSGSAIEMSHSTNGADKTGAALGLAIDNGGASTNAASLFFSTASSGSISERLRITSTGQLLVGTGSARTNLKNGNGNGATPKFQFETANVDEQNDISLIFGRNNAFGAEIILAKHRAATVGGNNAVQSDDRLGGINFAGSDGSNFHPAALIQGRVDGSPGTGDMPGRLEFLTTADSEVIPAVRMSIKSDGEVNLTGELSITNTVPSITLTDSANSQYAYIDGNSGNLILHSDKGNTGSSSTLKLAVDNNVKVTVDSSGDLEIHDGDLKVASGHGIDFSATANGTGTNHNELLDDYEEGDWQPTVSNGGASWSTTGRYTKVGRLVTLQADITNTSGSGTTEIHNLPFTVHSKYGTWHAGYAAVNGTTTSGNTNHTGGLVHFTGNGFLRARVSGGTQNVTMNNNHRTIFTATYFTSQ